MTIWFIFSIFSLVVGFRLSLVHSVKLYVCVMYFDFIFIFYCSTVCPAQDFLLCFYLLIVMLYSYLFVVLHAV